MRRIIVLVIGLLIISVAHADFYEKIGKLCYLIKDDGTAVVVYPTYRAKYEFNRSPKYEGDIVIPSKVTTRGGGSYTVVEIADNAFSEQHITSVSIPNTVKKVGTWAFSYCKMLGSITFPNSVKEIGDGCCTHCENLRTATLPQGIKAINIEMFMSCSSLTSIVIPSGVTIIKGGAFAGCSSLKTITIPISVTTIGTEAFKNCKSLTKIDLPGVDLITDNCFSNCSATSISMPKIKKIWYNSFDRSNFARLEFPESLQTIVSNNQPTLLFGSSTKYVKIPMKFSDYTIKGNPNIAVDYFGQSALGNDATWEINLASKTLIIRGNRTCDFEENDRHPWDSFWQKIEHIEIKEGVKYLGVNIFNNFVDSVKTITLPNTLDSISDFAFSGLKSIKKLVVPNSVSYCGEGFAYNCERLEEITISNRMTRIPNSAFSGCTSLKSLVIPESVKSCGSEFLDNCTNLTEVIFPKVLDTISQGAFYDCSSIKTLRLPDSVKYCGPRLAAYCKNLSNVIMPHNLSAIKEESFLNCPNLKRINIPASVTNIERNAFDEQIAINYEGSLQEWVKINHNGLYKNDTLYIANSKIKNVYLESDSTIYVSDNAFRGFCNIDSVIISQNVDKLIVGKNAFLGSTVKSFIMRSGDCEIGEKAFKGCKVLSEVILPDNTNIIHSSFDSCMALTTITIPTNCIIKGNNLFNGCNYLSTIVWNKKDGRNIDEPLLLFRSVSKNIENVIFGDSVFVIPDNVFSTFSKVKHIHIPDNVLKIGGSAFAGSGIRSISGMKNVKVIDHHAFSRINLDTLVIPNGVMVLSPGLFAQSKINTLIIPNSVKAIRGNCFNQASIDSLVISDSLETVDAFAFYGSNFKKLVLPESVKYLGEQSFCNCAISELTILSQNAPNMSSDNIFIWRDTPIIVSVPKKAKKSYTSHIIWKLLIKNKIVKIKTIKNS